MLVVFVQKLCTTFHEFAPAWQGGFLAEEALDHYRGRLSTRTRIVVDALDDNGLGSTDMARDFRRLLQSIEAARSMDELASLSEVVHGLGHGLCDWLEAVE
jgi:hypothetical protein